MSADFLFGGIQTRPFMPGAADPRRSSSNGLGNQFARLVNAVESTNQVANEAVSNMVDGTGDVHDAMIALQRSDLTLQFSVQVRNKLVQAYQEIMRMPV